MSYHGGHYQMQVLQALFNQEMANNWAPKEKSFTEILKDNSGKLEKECQSRQRKVAI